MDKGFSCRGTPNIDAIFGIILYWLLMNASQALLLIRISWERFVFFRSPSTGGMCPFTDRQWSPSVSLDWSSVAMSSPGPRPTITLQFPAHVYGHHPTTADLSFILWWPKNEIVYLSIWTCQSFGPLLLWTG